MEITSTQPQDNVTIQQPFDIDAAMARIREAVRSFPKAAMFELAEQGYRSPFEQLVACIISIRTYDETSLPVARRLLEQASTPAEMVLLTPAEIDELIRDCTFHEPKSRQIWAIADRLVKEYQGVLPCDAEVLLSFSGVGPKCAHLALGIACGQPYISVDVHVHRVTNRWGYVQTRSPEKTLVALEAKLPEAYWVEINQLLVPFGKHICTGNRPHCSTCPVLELCQQVGVEQHR
jgi:endonuclease-3